MLSLSNITKTYTTGDTTVTALKGVSIEFRKHEFVSILGPSGCGKTTLLNIIGGLDRYDEGDLVIAKRSTKEYRDGDWDTYRNHSVGFVFQSYNLIMHQTVLSNVELALTLSGVSREERRARAIKALEQVGLGDQIHKKPNQMSGGQMQRVAIARALVNDPEIILADEPTGALDTATSVQIMEILKSISKEKLIIMVTHNPDLAAEYSSRIIRLLDGEVTEDSNPYVPSAEVEMAEPTEESPKEKPCKCRRKKKEGKGKRSMSFFTALALSFNNLLTKKTRTLLVSFAGSIGIIGIALILALSNGVNLFIAGVQEDTLSTYPLSIQQYTQDMTAMLSAMTGVSKEQEYDDNMIHVDDSMGSMMAAMSATQENNLEAFKKYIDEHYDEIKDLVTDIKYTYDFKLQIFTADGKTQVNPSSIFDNMGDAFSGIGQLMGDLSVFSEMINNQELLDQQYEVVAGSWPTSKNEVVLVVNENNQLSKMTLYMLGVLDQGELEGIMKELMQNGKYDTTPLDPYPLDYFLGMRFKLLNTADFYQVNTAMPQYTVNGTDYYPVWDDVRDNVGYDQAAFVTANGIDLTISGIIRPQKGVAATSISGAIGYTKDLTDYILEQNAASAVIDQQKNKTPEHNVLTGLKFEKTVYTKDNIQELINTIDPATMQSLYDYMTVQMQAAFKENPPVNAESFAGFAMIMDDEQYAALVTQMLAIATANPANTPALAMLLGTVQSMLNIEGLTVTADNLISLLPLLGTAERYVLINGLTEPFPISGLHTICAAAMADIYAYMNEQLLLISVDATNFALMLKTMDDAEFSAMQETLYRLAPQTDATKDSVLTLLGDAEKAKPASINFYAVDFESKEKIEDFITAYNNQTSEADQLKYTDIIGIMMSSVTVIINAISYVLIAFVSISLVVSSIMIGIITYISVLERTKEIGILRAIGASKRDISRVFNAETLIIGFAAGVIGIGLTLLFCIPINIIIRALSGLTNIKAVLPVLAAFILVAISMGLTLIAGLIPSRIASKKDPVIALRSE